MVNKLVRSTEGLLILELVIGIAITVWGYYIDTKYLLPVLIAVVCYLALSAKMGYHFAQEDELFRKFPLLKTLTDSKADSDTVEAISSQSNLKSEALRQVHNQIWEEYRENIRRMSVDQRTGDLDYSLYVRLITERVRSAKSGEVIHAISFLTEGEFDDNPLERDFHQAQIGAKARGVTVNRIFICTAAALDELKLTQYWNAHKAGDIPSWYIPSYLFTQMKLDRKLSTGLVAFLDQLFIDTAATNNWLAGHLTVRPEEIKRAMTVFSECKAIATYISADA